MKTVHTHDFDAFAEQLPLTDGQSLEFGGNRVTRIDAKTIELEGKDTHVRISPGRIEILRGDVLRLSPGGNA